MLIETNVLFSIAEYEMMHFLCYVMDVTGADEPHVSNYANILSKNNYQNQRNLKPCELSIVSMPSPTMTNLITLHVVYVHLKNVLIFHME